ncbi:hypothetical protein TSUD_357860 [Trifolium subterraneum]|uniref:Uncharacterized protein n=1 Tax=Trifolium subterraneum TaxID=3900 RepID=A0A2Z6MYJ9_TRISU|nr:hypothetical protein TSUD_357860 [Trifolium subterraneum]
MVLNQLESIYDSEFLDTLHFRSGRSRPLLGPKTDQRRMDNLSLVFEIQRVSALTPSSKIDSSQSLRKRLTVPTTFTPFIKSFPPFSAKRLVI